MNINNIYYEPLKNRSEDNMPGYIPNDMLMEINNDNKYNTIFTVEDLIKLINKAIYFPFRMRYRQNKHNSNMSEMIGNFISKLEPMRHTTDDNNRIIDSYFTLLTGNKLTCKSYKQCISIDKLDNIKLVPYKESDTNNIIYIAINGTYIGGFINDPSFVNSLTEKERGFLVRLFDIFNKIDASGNSLQKHEYFSGLNLAKYMATPANKTKTTRINWSNRVMVKEIPSWRNNIVRGGSTRRKNKKRIHKRKSHKKSRKTIYNRNKK